MKWFKKATRYECEIAPTARLLYLITLTDNDTIASRMLVLRIPFKRWKKYIDPWHFGHTEGWCIPIVTARYNVIRRQFSFNLFWEPTNV